MAIWFEKYGKYNWELKKTRPIFAIEKKTYEEVFQDNWVIDMKKTVNKKSFSQKMLLIYNFGLWVKIYHKRFSIEKWC